MTGGGTATDAFATAFADAQIALGQRLRIRIHVRSFDAMCQMVAAGLGVAVLPEAAARPLVKALGLRLVALTDPWVERDLLLAAPAGPRPTLGLDPGFRSVTKAAVVDGTGKMLATATVYPHEPQRRWDEALLVLGRLAEAHRVELVAVGNGTASRETDRLACRMPIRMSVGVPIRRLQRCTHLYILPSRSCFASQRALVDL